MSELLNQLMKQVSSLTFEEKQQLLKALQEDIAEFEQIEEQKKKNQAAIKLIEEWQSDPSDYDIEAWKKLAPLLEENSCIEAEIKA